MEPKDAITAIGIFLSFSVSLAALYFSQFRRPNIKMIMGPRIHIYYPTDGGAAIYLPVVFYNTSPAGGFVYRAYLNVKSPNGSCISLFWVQSAEISPDTIEYKYTGPSKPFHIVGKGAVGDVFWFLHPEAPPNVSELRFIEGKYEIELCVWTKWSNIPDVKLSESFNIDRDSHIKLQLNKDEKSSTTRVIPLNGADPIMIRSGSGFPREFPIK